MALLRVWLLGLVALAIWFVCLWGSVPYKPASVPPNGSAFSVENAEHVLARVLGPEKPHPVSSAENAAVRGRILNELAALGIPARTYTAFTCNEQDARKFGVLPCATVTDIIADVVPGTGKAIVMMAHYDSVPAGPGASDDESSVATILEATRALKAGHGKSLHPVIALITDGEEAGLLGANAFLQNAALKARVGAVVNVEARGTSGASLLFQTSPGDARLIDLYAASVPQYATSSLFAEIYKRLPNDTDLTLFIDAGFTSFNFAFADNVRYYHSPLDLRRNLSRATLAMHGNNLLGMVRGLEHTDYAALRDGNDVYLSILQVWLPRIPTGLALPLSVLVFVVIAIAGWLTRQPNIGPGTTLRAALMPLALLAGCLVLGFVFAFIARIVSAMPDPTYAYPLPMRIALGLGVWGMTMLVARMTSVHGAAASAWLWVAGLAIVTAVTLPGLSPYFLFPSLVAAPLLLVAAFVPGKWDGLLGGIALFVAALTALLVWFPLVVTGETLMGLKLHPLFTLPAAFGLMTLVPLMARWPRAHLSWVSCETFVFIAAVLVAILAGLYPAYSRASPQRLNLIYFENGNRPARWIADTSWKAKAPEPIPASLRKAGGFHYDKEAYAGLDLGAGDVAPAGSPSYPLPSATVVSDSNTGGMRHVTVRLRGSAAAHAMVLVVPKQAQLVSLDVRGQHVAAQAPGDFRLICASRDCSDLSFSLTLRSMEPVTLKFAERRYGLPAFGAKLAAARPNTAMPSQSGDGVLLANSVALSPR
ncbi:MAG TPA: M20/M25/M40 family metallo-hydrolase [Rhizomicrobium sp.]|jgi:hypothetical protein